MCCIDLLKPLSDLQDYPLGVAEIEVAKAERVDVKLEMADTPNQIFLAFQQETVGRASLRKVLTADERTWKPNRICIAGLDTVANNTIKLLRIGLDR